MAQEEKKLTVRNALSWGGRELLKSGVPDPRVEAEYLLSFVLKAKRHELFTGSERVMTEKEIDEYEGFIKRKTLREPSQYITGETEFRGLSFKVTPQVLIPRPETELLVEEAVNILKGLKSKGIVIDLCTGSGCIATSIAKELDNVLVYAVDISKEALKVAGINAARHNVGSRVKFMEGDLFTPLAGLGLKGKADIIVSNPPYISKDEIEKLPPEIKDFEPVQALQGGADGLEFIRRIIIGSPEYLTPGGYLIMEIGWNESPAVKEIILKSWAYGDIEIKKDLSGIERVVKAGYRG